jgi:hypothetical protein
MSRVRLCQAIIGLGYPQSHLVGTVLVRSMLHTWAQNLPDTLSFIHSPGLMAWQSAQHMGGFGQVFVE